jgi:penicillin-binding protein 1C
MILDSISMLRHKWSVTAGSILLAIVGVLAWPLPSQIAHPDTSHSVRVLDREGKTLYIDRDPETGLHESLRLADVPPHIIHALLATEDRGFYGHAGVSVRGTLRALWSNILAGRVVEGGSTITQQLVRHLLAPRPRTLLSKAWEALLAVRLELRRSKDQILEEYLNTAYFGHGANGLAPAARVFLGKNVAELSVAEGAFLVGLLQSPVALDPFRAFDAAKNRQREVLQNMVEIHLMSQEESADLAAQQIRLAPDRVPIEAPHFVMLALEESKIQDPGSKTELKTTLSLDLQQAAERIVDRQLKKLAGRNVTSAAVVVLDARTGDVLAMVGSADYFDVQHDGAVNVALSPRQPGSALKPFTYALALLSGDTPATTVADVEAQFLTEEGNPYVPRNYDFEQHGLVRYRSALANSYNIAAVRVLEKVGVDKLLEFLRDAGITTLTEPPDHYGLALTLGAGEVRLLELAEAYGVFAREGRTLHHRFLFEEDVDPGRRILDERAAWLIADILSDNDARVPEFGVDSPLRFDVPVAAKTGTTRNSRDNWVVGFTPDRIVGVWVGNADNTPMRDTSGVTGAGPIFHDVMVEALRGIDPVPFARPAGITDAVICSLSGKLPTPECPQVMTEHFIAGTEPTELDDIHRRIDGKVYALFPPELQRWARENGWPQPPTDPLLTLSSSSPLTITHPKAGDSFRLDPLIPDVSEKILFEARATGDIAEVTWLVNGAIVGIGKAPDYRYRWTPVLGTHQIEARGGGLNAMAHVEIVR